MKAKLCFFDDYYIAARPGTKRRTFKPQKFGEFSDNNASLQLYTSFFYDTLSSKYRLYYEVPASGKGTEVRVLKLAEADCVKDFIEGKVKITTVKGLDDEHGVHGCAVTFNPDATDVNKRYILLGNAYADDKSKRYFCRSFSSDGKTFSGVQRVYPQNCFLDYKDTYNSVYYNPYLKEFQATTRCATMDRRIAVITSKDGETWSEPRLILHPQAQGNTGVQYYALGVSHIDGLFYGILWRFMTDIGRADFTDMSGYMENDLLYSYDGTCFSSTGLEPVCERPLPPEYGCKQLWLLNIAEANDKYILCGGATNIAHGASYGNGKFAITVFYEIRKDGFCALEGFGKNSIVYTKPILFDGGNVELNFNAISGRVDVAILDIDGNEIEGFGFSDCVPFEKTDTVKGRLTYKNADVNTLCKKQIRFAIRLDNALIYSMSFEGKPFLHSRPQMSFNNPAPITEY